MVYNSYVSGAQFKNGVIIIIAVRSVLFRICFLFRKLPDFSIKSTNNYFLRFVVPHSHLGIHDNYHSEKELCRFRSDELFFFNRNTFINNNSFNIKKGE